MSRLLASLSLFVVLVASAPALAVQHTHSTVNLNNNDAPVVKTIDVANFDIPVPAAELRVYDGQLSSIVVESPEVKSRVRVVNNAKTDADVDFIAVDVDGAEHRQTMVVAPGHKARFSLGKVFPSLTFVDGISVEVRAAARPAVAETKVQALLPVAFFSQRNPPWAGDRLGTCSSSTTIGTDGCAISSIAMAGARSVNNFNPATLNSYLTDNGGYSSGCLVRWASPANIDGTGGFVYIGSGGTVTSAAKLKGIIDQDRFAVARSYRFAGHYVVIIGYNGNGSRLSDFVYLDPWDLSAVYRYVGDGRVTTSSSMQIYH